jgi:outer membrane biosynthesis protein TonB
MRHHVTAGVAAVFLAACASAPQSKGAVTYNEKDVPLILRPGRETDRLTWYPDDQRRLHHVGNVTLVYSVSAEGRAVDVRAVGDSTPEFVPSATQLLQSLRFSIPRNWVARVGPSLRRQFHVAYNLECMPKAVAGADTVVITGSCLR